MSAPLVCLVVLDALAAAQLDQRLEVAQVAVDTAVGHEPQQV